MVRFLSFRLFFTRRMIFELQFVLVRIMFARKLPQLEISSLPLPLPYCSRVDSVDLRSPRGPVAINAIAYSRLGRGFPFHRISASSSASSFPCLQLRPLTVSHYFAQYHSDPLTSPIGLGGMEYAPSLYPHPAFVTFHHSPCGFFLSYPASRRSGNEQVHSRYVWKKCLPHVLMRENIVYFLNFFHRCGVALTFISFSIPCLAQKFDSGDSMGLCYTVFVFHCI